MKTPQEGDPGWARVNHLDPLVFGNMPPAESEVILLEITLLSGHTRQVRVRKAECFDWMDRHGGILSYRIIDDVIPGTEEGGSASVCACAQCDLEAREIKRIMLQEQKQLGRWQAEAREASAMLLQ